MNILKRIRAKLQLWYKFYKVVANFYTVLWYRAVGLFRLNKIIRYDAFVFLKNGTRLYYGNLVDKSTVPAVVEVWQEQVYTPAGFSIEPTDIVFDIGANIGNFSLFAAQRTHGLIYAFEPMPQNFAALQRNIQLRNGSNIVPVGKAVTGRDGSVTMHVSDVSSAHSVTHELFGRGKTLEVPCVTLDTFCRENRVPRIDFLKIDCEGAEFEIILGLSEDLTSRIGKIIMEHHERYMHGDHRNIMSFLEKRGFKVREFEEQYISAMK